MIKKLSTLVFVLTAFNAAHATSLITAYQQALQFNPSYLGSNANTQVAKDQIAISRAALLPSLSTSGNYQYSTNDNFHTNSQGAGYGLELQQTLFDFSKFKNLAGSKASAAAAKFTRLAAKQDLMVQVTKAYLDLALAKTTLTQDQKKLDDQQKVFQEANQQFNAGQTTRTNVTDAKAALTATQTSLILDQAEVDKKISALTKITGTATTTVGKINSTLIAQTPAGSLSQWIKKARLNNLAIQADRYSLSAARYAIDAARAGHLPTLNAFAGYNSQYQLNQANNNLSPNIPSKGISAGVNLSFPIYSGGAILAHSKQSQDQYQVSYQKLRETTQATFDQLRQSYATLINSAKLIKNLRASVTLQQQAVDDTIISYHAGQQSMSDIVLAQDRLYDQQQQYYTQQYAYINAYLQFLQAAGTLNQANLTHVNHWLS